MMHFDLEDAIKILSQTPATIRSLVMGLQDSWLHADEGPDTWAPQSVVAHLIYGEQTDWIPRMQIILDPTADKHFIPFDREGHFPLAKERNIEALLVQFDQLRKENLQILIASHITSDDLKKTGIHPAFGPVSLQQLLAAWVVHDMTHVSQIARIIARQYQEEVGPWKEYMGILNWR